MNGWILAVVILLALDAMGRPFVIGKVRTPSEMYGSVVLDVIAVLCLLKGAGVL